MEKGKKEKFQKIVWTYYKNYRREMPWRNATDPYKIFVSEVMLQQTQVPRVIAKYETFIKKFPDFRTLAKAPFREVLLLWQGLGYNRRALFLKRAAEIVVEKYDGSLPEQFEAIDALPGIGSHTAGAILAYVWDKPSVFIETNIRTVFIHHFFPRSKHVRDQEIIGLVQGTLDVKRPREWYYALMDYGAFLKQSVGNVSRKSASYTKQSKFEGSHRQIRGKILAIVAEKGAVSLSMLSKKISGDRKLVIKIVRALVDEGFLKKVHRCYCVI